MIKSLSSYQSEHIDIYKTSTKYNGIINDAKQL